MSTDIVKQIVLKFKGDTKDIEKSVKSMTDALNKLEKGGASAASNKLAKSFQDFSKSAQSAGVSIGKEFTKLQKVIQNIAKNDLQQISKQTEQIAVKAERRLKKFQDLENSGASGPKVDRARRLASGTSDKLEAFMDLFNQRAQGIGGGQQPPGGGGMAGMFGGGAGGQFMSSFLTAGAIAAAPAKIANFAMERHRQALVNPSIASNLEIQQRVAAYSGNAEMAVLARKGSVERAKRFGENNQFWGKVKDYGTLGVGALLLGGGAALSATGVGAGLGIPAAALGGSMIAGAGAMAYGGAGAADRVFNNKGEREKAQGFSEAISAERNRLIDPYLYDQFRGKASGRAKLQQQFDVTSQEAFNLRVQGLGQNITPEEQESMMRAFRPMGARNAGRLSVIAGQEALTQGMSTDSSAAMLQSMTMNGKGTGTLNAQKGMEDMFRRAVEGGVTDAGLREQLEKATTAILDSSNTRMDAGQLMQNLLQYLPAGPQGQMDPRAIQAAADAQKIREGRFEATAPLDDALKRSVITQTLGEGGQKIKLGDIDYIRSRTMAQLDQPDKNLEDMGISAEKAKEMKTRIEAAQANVNPDERAALADIEKSRQSGQVITDKQLRALDRASTSATGGSGAFKGESEEARLALAKARVSGNGNQFESGITAAQDTAILSPDQLSKRVIDDVRKRDEARRSSPEGQQQKAELTGQQQLEKDINRVISPNIGDILKTQNAANKQVSRAGEESDPGKSATSAIAAMDKFAGALDRLADRINGRYGGVASPGE